MNITVKHVTTTVAALVLLSACGAGGSPAVSPGSPTAAPTPTPAATPIPAPAATPSPTPDPNAAFKDYQLPYLPPAQGIYTVSASTLTNPTQRSTISPKAFPTIMDGEWNNGILTHKRPALMALLGNGQWQYMTLRDVNGVGFFSTGITENRQLCYVTFVEDYFDPRQSVIIYSTPAADASGACIGSKDEFHVFQLNSNHSSEVGTLRSGAALPRVFRGSKGEITAYILQGQSNLILVKPDGSYSTIASGVSGRAYQAARTADTLWLTWIQGGVSSLFRITANGSVSAPLASSNSSEFFRGTADRDAIYLSHLKPAANNSSQNSQEDTEIVSVSYAGTTKSLTAIHNDTAIIAADSETSLLIDATTQPSDAGTDLGYFLLPKNGGSAIKLDPGVSYKTMSFVAAVRNEQFLFNSYCFSCSGNSVTGALIYNSSGKLVTSYDHSQWIGSSSDDENYGDPSSVRAYRAGRLGGVSDSYNDQTVGHQGSVLLNQNFSTNTIRRFGSVDFPGYVSYALGLPADFIALSQYSRNGQGVYQLSNVDLFGIDLDKDTQNRLTNTDRVCERIPYVPGFDC